MNASEGLTIGDRTYARFREVPSPSPNHKVSLASVLFLLWWFLSSILLVWWARRLSDTGDVRGVQILGLTFAVSSLILPLCLAPFLAKKSKAKGSEIPADLPLKPTSGAVLAKLHIKLGAEDGVVDHGWITLTRDDVSFHGRRCAFRLTAADVAKVSRSGYWISMSLKKDRNVPRHLISIWTYESSGSLAFGSVALAQILENSIAALLPSNMPSLFPPLNLPWPTTIDRGKVIRFACYGLLGGAGLGLLAMLSILLTKSAGPPKDAVVMLSVFTLTGLLSGVLFAMERPLQARTRNKQIEKWQQQARKN